MKATVAKLMRLAIAFVALATPVAAQRPTTEGRASADSACAMADGSATEPIALVLSGGGAHGIAHIGVLEVLDSPGIRPDLVVGPSIRAPVGRLHAGGM